MRVGATCSAPRSPDPQGKSVLLVGGLLAGFAGGVYSLDRFLCRGKERSAATLETAAV